MYDEFNGTLWIAQKLTNVPLILVLMMASVRMSVIRTSALVKLTMDTKVPDVGKVRVQAILLYVT